MQTADANCAVNLQVTVVNTNGSEANSWLI